MTRKTYYQYDQNGNICAKVTTEGDIEAENCFAVESGSLPPSIFGMKYNPATKEAYKADKDGKKIAETTLDINDYIVE